MKMLYLDGLTFSVSRISRPCLSVILPFDQLRLTILSFSAMFPRFRCLPEDQHPSKIMNKLKVSAKQLKKHTHIF